MIFFFFLLWFFSPVNSLHEFFLFQECFSNQCMLSQCSYKIGTCLVQGPFKKRTFPLCHLPPLLLPYKFAHKCNRIPLNFFSARGKKINDLRSVSGLHRRHEEGGVSTLCVQPFAKKKEKNHVCSLENWLIANPQGLWNIALECGSFFALEHHTKRQDQQFVNIYRALRYVFCKNPRNN